MSPGLHATRNRTNAIQVGLAHGRPAPLARIDGAGWKTARSDRARVGARAAARHCPCPAAWPPQSGFRRKPALDPGPCARPQRGAASRHEGSRARGAWIEHADAIHHPADRRFVVDLLLRAVRGGRRMTSAGSSRRPQATSEALARSSGIIRRSSPRPLFWRNAKSFRSMMLPERVQYLAAHAAVQTRMERGGRRCSQADIPQTADGRSDSRSEADSTVAKKHRPARAGRCGRNSLPIDASRRPAGQVGRLRTRP